MRIEASSLRGVLKYEEPLAAYTAWRVGGPAEILYQPADAADLIYFLQALAPDIPITWLGLGSNTLVRDGGVRGAVIMTQGALNKIAFVENQMIRAEAGVGCGQLARFSARLNLSGLEFMAGIPGTVGGALAMNAGCHGAETWETVSTVEVLLRSGAVDVRPANLYQASYRHITKPDNSGFIAATFLLKPGSKEKSLQEIRALLARRAQTQPIHLPSAGSTFRNPPGDHAGRLIEACGLKGFKKGGACVSEKHANFIINEGNATATEIESLITWIGNTVEEKQNVRLQPEVCIIGT